MSSLLDRIPMNGQKTYIVGGLMVIYAVAGLMLGQLDMDSAMRTLIEGLGLVTLRHALTK